MKLISPFRDYYDGNLRYGLDESITYIRKTKAFEVVVNNYVLEELRDCYSCYLQFHLLKVGNITLPFVTQHMERSGKEPNPIKGFYPDRTSFLVGKLIKAEDGSIVSAPQLLSNFDVMFKPEELNLPDYKYGFNFSKKSTNWLSVGNIEDKDTKEDILTIYWDIKTNQYSKVTEYIKINNPRLSDFGIQKILDSYSISNELMMLLANKARPEPDMAVIEDKYKIQQHGFDNKVSFRKRRA